MTNLRAVGRPYRTFAQVAFALVLAAVVAVALWWGFLREHAPMAARGIRVSADFAALPNGPAPDSFAGGQAATVVTSSDPLKVQDGRLTYQPTTAGSAAFFSTPDLGSSVKNMGARFVFRSSGGAGPGTQGAIALVVSRGIENRVPPMINPLAVQLVVTPINWNISVLRSDNATLDVVAADFFPQPLREDGVTSYEARVTIDGAQVTLDLPGTHRIVSDPRFSEWQGSFATFELYSDHGTTDSIGAFQKIWASGNKD
jgi:hypothetical protein